MTNLTGMPAVGPRRVPLVSLGYGTKLQACCNRPPLVFGRIRIFRVRHFFYPKSDSQRESIGYEIC